MNIIDIIFIKKHIISISLIILSIVGFFYIQSNSTYTATNGIMFVKDNIKCTMDGDLNEDIISSCTSTKCNKSVFENRMEMCSKQNKKNKRCIAIAGILNGTKIKYTPCSRFTVDPQNPIKGGFIP